MRTLLRIDTGIPWMPADSEARLIHTDEMPPLALCGTALAFAFQGENMLMARLVKRGWDIPGGHIEPGETPEQAVIRETIEEAGVVVEPLELVGVQELVVFGDLPREGWTRPLGYQLFYLCRVKEILPFVATAESAGRGFLTPEQMRAEKTTKNHDVLYEIALERAKKMAFS